MPEYHRKKQYSGIKNLGTRMSRGNGRGIRIRTLNDGVRGLQSFFKTAYLSHFSDFASLKNLSEFYFCSARQIRMRNCEPYTEVSKETLNPHYHLQYGSASFDDEEYKRSLFNRIQSKFRSHIFYCFLFIHSLITFDISSFIQMDLCCISVGQTA